MKNLDPVKNEILDFARAWEEEFGDHYLIMWGKEHKWAQLLLEMQISPDEKVARRRRFFARTDDWIIAARWNLATFVNNLEKWVPDKPVKKQVPVTFRTLTFQCSDCGKPRTEADHVCERWEGA